MRRRPRSLAGVLLVVALLAVLTVQPARAQTPNGLQLFTEVYRLITQEALAPAGPIGPLRAAAGGGARAPAGGGPPRPWGSPPPPPATGCCRRTSSCP